MANQPRRVSRVLDSRPRIFSLPASIILPAMFITAASLALTMAFGWPLYMLFLSVLTFNAAYFFLFGQEWWRLVVRFSTPPAWVRADIPAKPFSLVRHESKSKRADSEHRRL
ncbi:MAG: hypothetical protein AAF810_08745 [Cyanobacteria bacterium P01_D01_bin.36]